MQQIVQATASELHDAAILFAKYREFYTGLFELERAEIFLRKR